MAMGPLILNPVNFHMLAALIPILSFACIEREIYLCLIVMIR